MEFFRKKKIYKNILNYSIVIKQKIKTTTEWVERSTGSRLQQTNTSKELEDYEEYDLYC
jgi:hypothetical protein